MSITQSEIESTLRSAGLQRTHETKKKVLFVHPSTDETIYLNRDPARRSPGLVIHPRHAPSRQTLVAIPGVVPEGELYHSSNMRRFPMRRNGGASDIPYGIPFGFESVPSLQTFLGQLLGSPRDALEDINAAAGELNKAPPTEKDAIVKSRIGQGPFRVALEQYWKSCAVTGCCVLPALRASHIKPWRESSNNERLDPYNGLLLTANIDALFDRGLLTFADDGIALLSSKIALEEARLLGVDHALRLRSVDPKHQSYLAFHRANVFIA